jgi:hypothetical protein
VKSDKNLVSAYQSYFQNQREIVYLNLNKEIFISGERLYFSAFILNQQTRLPREISTNLYVGLYDSQGRQLQKTMWEVTDGVAYGSLEVKSDYGHGIHFVKADTHWMKNFKTKTHAIQKIQVVQYDGQNEDKEHGIHNMEIRLEGSRVISQIINTIGFHVSEQSGLGIQIKEGKILDSSGKVILENLRSNESGLGKFDLFVQEGEEYICELTTIHNQVLRKKLPAPVKGGFALNVTGNSANRIISVRTNENSFEKNRDSRYFLVIHKNGKIKNLSFSLDRKQKSFSLPQKNLLDGVNIISLLDEKGNVQSERLIYNSFPVVNNVLESKIIEYSQEKDSLLLEVKLKKQKKEQIALSISILPEESINYNRKTSIQEALLIAPFLDEKILFLPWLVQTSNNKSFMDLDLLMLMYGRSNFSWAFLKEGSQTPLYPMENGISVSGRVKNKNLDKIKSVLMYQDQIQGMKSSQIDEKGKFYIDNALVRKDQLVHFSLLDHKSKLLKPELEVNFSPKNRVDTLDVSFLEKRIDLIDPDEVPNIQLNTWLEDKRSRYLDEIILTTKIENSKPKRNEYLKAGFWNANKISEDDVVRKRSLSNYLRSLGFKVKTDPITGWLFVLPKLLLNPMIQPPSIYLNGFRLSRGLPDYQLHSIDEVYYEHAGLMESNGGTIYIYLREGSIVGQENKNRFTSLLADSGFDSPDEFGNFIGEEDVDKLFKKYGCIYWEPKAVKNEKGELFVKFPSLGLNRFKVFIEGISADGTLFSQAELIELSTD